MSHCVSHCVSQTYPPLYVTDRSIKDLNELSSLRRLRLFGNPVCDKADYKQKLLLVCPRLTHIDGKSVQEEDISTEPETTPAEVSDL